VLLDEGVPVQVDDARVVRERKNVQLRHAAIIHALVVLWTRQRRRLHNTHAASLEGGAVDRPRHKTGWHYYHAVCSGVGTQARQAVYVDDHGAHVDVTRCIKHVRAAAAALAL
jgi:hypothetical protein